MEDGAEGGVGGTGRFAVAEAIGNRAFVDCACCIDIRDRSGPTDLGTMTTRAGLVLLNGEILIEKDGLSELLFGSAPLLG